ncbi:g2711 [Coccomyxa elongata]
MMKIQHQLRRTGVIFNIQQGCEDIVREAVSTAGPSKTDLPAEWDCVFIRTLPDLVPYTLSATEDGALSLVPAKESLLGFDAKPAHLDIQQKDGYLGLRCLEAKGRFLQARRRAPHKLCFFSGHWGIWEQWQVKACLAPENGGEVERELHLSPRQLPNFVWHIRVAPVGYASTGMHAHPSGRSRHRGMCEQPPADGILDLSMRLTAGFAQRFHRRPLPAAFAVWRQLVQQRRNCMGQLRKSARRWQQRWLRDSFHRWHAGAAATRRRRSLLQRGLHRHTARMLAHAFQAWLALATRRRELAVIGGKLASMHMRCAHAAVLAAWQMEVRCRRRLTVLAERLTAAAAQRRMRAAFLAWFEVVLTPDPPAARAPGKVRLIELTPNPLFDTEPRRLVLQSPGHCGPTAPFTFPRTSRQCALLGLAARPSLAQLPADLLQRLDSAANAAPEAPAAANRRGGCATDVRPAAPGLKWPFRFGGYLEPAGTSGVPDQAARQWPDQATQPVQAARHWPDQATPQEGTPALPGRAQREATPFYTPAADISCLLAATPLTTPAVRHHFNWPSMSVAAAEDTTGQAHLGHCPTVSPQVAASGSPGQPTSQVISPACVEGRSTAWQQQEQTRAAEQDLHVSLPETDARREQTPRPSLEDCQDASAGDLPVQLSVAQPTLAPLLLNEGTINGALPSVCGPRHGTPALEISDRHRRESTGSWSPATSLAELTPDLSRLAAPALPAVPPKVESASTDAHAAIPDQLQPATSPSCAGQPQEAVALRFARYGSAASSGEPTRAAAQPPPMPDFALVLSPQQSLLPDQATPSAAQQLPSPVQATPSAAQQLPPPDQVSPAAAVQLPVPTRTLHSAAEQPPLPDQEDAREDRSPAQAVALHFVRRQLCMRALCAWLAYVDGRRERWDMLRKAIAFRVQRLQWAVLSALRQHVQQQQEHRERCSASEPQQGAVLALSNREGDHEWPSRGDETYRGVDESPIGASGGAMPLQEEITSGQAVCERADSGAEGVQSMRFCSDRVQAHASGNSIVGASGQHLEDTDEADLLNQAGLDGSLAAVFRAWQEATVLQWQRRIGVTEALVRRRQWRSLAWPFRAWAALADERHRNAVEASGLSHGTVAMDLRMQAFVRERARRLLSDAFWHWQDTTVWEWKRRRDSVALARLRALGRLLHAWHGLVNQPAEASSAPVRTLQSQTAASASSKEQARTSETTAGSAAAVSEVGSASMQEAASRGFCVWRKEAALTAAKKRGATGIARSRRLRWALACWRAAAADSRAARGAVAEFRHRQARRCASAALRAWQSRARLLAAVRHGRAAAAAMLSRACFAAWRRHIAQARGVAAAVSRTEARRLQLALSAWRAVVADTGRLRMVDAAICCAHARRRQAKVLEAFRAAIGQARQRRDAAEAAGVTRRRKAAAAAFAAWGQAVAEARERDLAADAFSVSVAINRSAAILRAWRQAAAAAREAAAAAEGLAERGRQKFMHTVLCEWRDAVAGCSFEREQAAQTFLHAAAARRAAEVLAAWREAVIDAHAAAASAEQLVERRRARMLRSAFAAWRIANATLAHARSEALGRFARKGAAARLCAALAAWGHVAHDAKALKAAAAAFQEQRRHRGLRAAFAAWRVANATLAHERSALLDAFHYQSATRRTAASFAAWCRSVDDTRAAAAAAEELSLQAEHRLLQGAFLAWRIAAVTSAHNRAAALGRSTAWAADRRLRAALAAWRLYVSDARAAKTAALELGDRLQRARMSSFLAAWRGESTKGQSQVSAAVGSFRARSAGRAVGRFLFKWKLAAASAQRAAAAAEAMAAGSQLRALRECFALWRLAQRCSAHEQASASETLASAAAERRLTAVLHSWRQVVAEARSATAAADAISTRLHRRSLHGVLAAWRTVAAESALERAAVEDHAFQLARRLRLQRFFLSWRTAAAGAAAAASAAAGKLRGGAARRRLAGAFQTWRSEAADAAQGVSAALAAMAERTAARRLAAVLVSWQQLAAERRERDAAAEGFAGVLRLRRVLTAWQSKVVDQAHHRAELLRAFLLRPAAGRLRTVFASWRLSAHGLGAARRAAELAAAGAWTGRLLSMAFQGWRCRAEGLKRQRQLREHATRMVRLARCFYRWAEAAAARREGDVAASCAAEAATQAACLSLTTHIASLEEQRSELQRRAAHAPGWAQLSGLRQRAASLQEDLATTNAAVAEQLSSKFLLQHASTSEAAGLAGNPLLRDTVSPSPVSDKGTDEASMPTAWHEASLTTSVQKAGGDVRDQSTPDPDHLRPPWHPPAGKLLLATFEEEAARS